jgi:hypothetical protein
MKPAGLLWGALALSLWLTISASGCGDDEGNKGQPSPPAEDMGEGDVPEGDTPEDCSPGTEGCRCLSDDTCRLSSLACVDGICEAPRSECDPLLGPCPPEAPVCYTPCRGDLFTAEGQRRRCSPDGLLEGCLDGSLCDRGSCVPMTTRRAGLALGQSEPEEAPGECALEADCPIFQTCLQGRCYSNCAGDAECGQDAAGNKQTCFLRVCRSQCVGDLRCPTGSACHDGVCLPLTAAGEEVVLDEFSFDISASNVRFTAAEDRVTLLVANTGASALALTVEKTEQASLDNQGRLQVITENPLTWLQLNGQSAGPLTLNIPAGEVAEVEISAAGAGSLPRWEGRLRLSAPKAGAQELRLSYSQDLQGRWAGKIYTFGNFPDGFNPTTMEAPLDAWMAAPENTALLNDVPNAFLQAWGRYRNGQIGVDEMAALLDATLTGSWKFPRVRELCAESFDAENTICAPFGGLGSQSVIPYTTTALTSPVPSGVIEQDFALHLRPASGADCVGEGCMVGRIDSQTALQYAGSPKVRVGFSKAAGECDREGPLGCVTFVEHLDAEVAVGARSLRPGGAELALVETPWLVPGFSPLGSATPGLRQEYRDQRLPFDEAEDNLDFAAANPLPDGRPRRRTLTLVDGLLIQQQIMTLLLRESIDSFHGGPPLVSYHYVVLEKSPEDPPADQIEGFRPLQTTDSPSDFAPVCDGALLRTVLGRSAQLSSLGQADADKLAAAMVSGAVGAPSPLPDGLNLYSLCVWSEDAVQPGGQIASIRRELINAGPDGSRPCFPGAEVIYFATTEANLETENCNEFGNDGTGESCLGELATTFAAGADGPEFHFSPRAQSYLNTSSAQVSFDLGWRCRDGRPVCDDNRLDLLRSKEFFLTNNVSTFYSPLDTEIADAFRYKVQFVSRGGAQVGFAPVVCQGGASLAPYCYDPAGIERAQARVDCAQALYHGAVNGEVPLGDDARGALRGFLERNFSSLGDDPEDPVLSYGFERLYAELMILLGDDAYTSAFASRFDLAGTRLRAFEGSRFERGPDALDLSGAAGFELYQLYLASQYYDLVLERFYRQVVWLWENIEGDEGERYVSAATITTFLDRVIRASTQSANAWGEVARRYQSFNRQALARRVLSRAYTRTHQESLLLNAFMTQAIDAVEAEERPQVLVTIENTQRRYRVAMLDMQERHRQLSLELDFFGLPPDLIPFPALDEDSVNGFEPMLERARARLELATADEDVAIASRRDFDTDQAAFQNELVSLRNNYEAELGRICGSFIAEDGRTYPAIARYAHLSEDLAGLDDPCGAAGNGELWVKGGDLQGAELSLRKVRQEAANLLATMSDETARVEAQCDMINMDVDEFLRQQQVIENHEATISGLNITINRLDKIHDAITEFSARINDAVGDLDDGVTLPFVQIVKITQNAVYLGSALANVIGTGVLEGLIAGQESKIREAERQYEAYTLGRQCDYLLLEGAYNMRSLQREMLLTELDILNAIWNTQLEFSYIQELANERNRLETQWAEAEEMLFNVEAARNDPNIRIYKNDAILNADRSFEAALRDAWRLTRVYEYYTASSYAAREELFLVRTVNYGDISLRRYVEDLEEAFLGFEQVYGNPDARVITLSLRDDIFQIPYYTEDEAMRVLTAQERADLFRARLSDPANLNAEGALAFRFSTSFDQLSPLTINHKILFVEVELFGEEHGDNEGRVYLRQLGTGVVEGTDGQRRFFSFAPRTAVMNPIFNGVRDFGQDSDGAITGPTRSIFRSYRFRERPFVQTNWELVLDQRNERANQDISLGSVEDIVLSVFYTDFTKED